MQAAGQVRRARREVDPDEDHLAVAQLAGRGDGHHLLGRVVHGSPRSVSGSPFVDSPFSIRRSHAVNVSRSRLIFSHVEVGGVVAVVVAVRVRGRRPARHDRDGVDGEPGQHHAAGHRRQLVDDLLDRRDRVPGGEHGLLLDAADAPQLHVAVPIGALGVHDRHVRIQRGHGRQVLAGERAAHGGDGRRVPGQVGARGGAQHRERQAGRAGDVAVGQPGVGVLLDLQRAGPSGGDRVAQPVQRADARVAAPGEDQLSGAAGADDLVVDQVGGHPGERQVAAALADDLVARGERDQMGETLQRDRVAVVHELGHGVGQRHDLGHTRNASGRPPERQSRPGTVRRLPYDTPKELPASRSGVPFGGLR